MEASNGTRYLTVGLLVPDVVQDVDEFLSVSGLCR